MMIGIDFRETLRRGEGLLNRFGSFFQYSEVATRRVSRKRWASKPIAIASTIKVMMRTGNHAYDRRALSLWNDNFLLQHSVAT